MDKLKFWSKSSRRIIRERVVPFPGKVLHRLDFNPNDGAFFIYVLAVGVLIFIFRDALTLWPYYLLGQGTLAVTAYLIIRGSQALEWSSLTVLRHWYPVLSFTFLYMQAGLLNQMVFSGYWDDYFAAADRMLFGMEPGVWLVDTIGNYWTHEFMHACYFSYYLVPVTLGLILYKQKDAEFYRAMFGFSVTFYLCYFLYILIPVAGPLHLREGRFEDAGWFVGIMNSIYASVEKPGAAFPSSHVAIAMITLFYAWRSRRTLFWIILPIIAGLIVSTVYGFYHYVVDVIAGIVISVVSYHLCNKFYDRYASKYFPEAIP